MGSARLERFLGTHVSSIADSLVACQTLDESRWRDEEVLIASGLLDYRHHISNSIACGILHLKGYLDQFALSYVGGVLVVDETSIADNDRCSHLSTCL